MTIEERLDKLEHRCKLLENHMINVDLTLFNLRKVSWIPVIDLPESAKRILTEEELIERERETNRMWKTLFENENRDNGK